MNQTQMQNNQAHQIGQQQHQHQQAPMHGDMMAMMQKPLHQQPPSMPLPSTLMGSPSAFNSIPAVSGSNAALQRPPQFAPNLPPHQQQPSHNGIGGPSLQGPPQPMQPNFAPPNNQTRGTLPPLANNVALNQQMTNLSLNNSRTESPNHNFYSQAPPAAFPAQPMNHGFQQQQQQHQPPLQQYGMNQAAHAPLPFAPPPPQQQQQQQQQSNPNQQQFGAPPMSQPPFGGQQAAPPSQHPSYNPSGNQMATNQSNMLPQTGPSPPAMNQRAFQPPGPPFAPGQGGPLPPQQQPAYNQMQQPPMHPSQQHPQQQQQQQQQYPGMMPPHPSNLQGPPGRSPYPQPPQTQQMMPPHQQQQQQQQQQAGYQGQNMNHPQQFDQHPPQPQQMQQQPPKMDMDQIPNPIEVMQCNNAKFGGQYFETNEAGKIPPLITTDFLCKDAGNCNPRFMRSTLYSVPTNADLLKQSKLPLVLTLTPFAELKNTEREPPVSELGEMGPVRCKRCKAYMSPFMTFIDNGKRFQCPFCDDVSSVPDWYFNHLDHMGKRVDMYERPELCLGSYELTATKEYCRKETLPLPPAFIFMIDVSANSVRSGLLHALCPYIKNVILPNLPCDPLATAAAAAAAAAAGGNGADDEATAAAAAAASRSLVRVGFVTYDKELHFYNLKSTLAAPQMMIVSDTEEVFLPILDGFLVSVQESRAVIDTLLDALPGMFAESKETELVLGPVVEAGLEALRLSSAAGKLFVFHTNLPTALAPGQLKSRDDKKLLGTEREKQALTAQTDYYALLGKRCIDAACTVDLFLLPNQHCDVSTLHELCSKTSGQLYKYDFFTAEAHAERLCDDLRHAVDSSLAFDAVMKVRTSTGVKPVDYLGHCNMYGNDMELAGLQRQTSVCVELKHEDKLQENGRVYVQAALLYTSLSGRRRIRVHNLSLSVCTQYSQVFASCELDTLINYMAKLACRSVAVSTPKSIRDNMVQQVASILAAYRRHCTNAPAKGQFILPETLKLLPVFANSLLKSDTLTGSQNITVDERAWLMHRLMSMDLNSTYALFYPRLLQLTDMENSDTLLSPMRCIYERLKDDAIYLLENGLVMYLWIGANVDPQTIQNLFGVSGAQQLNIEKCQLLELDTPISLHVRSVIQRVNAERKAHLKLIVVRQRDNMEIFFKNLLVEDKGHMPNASSMLCAKSFELIKQLDSNMSTAHELSAFNEDNVRFTFEECRTLFAQNQIDVQPVLKGDNANLPTIQMRHAALQRNKRCLLTYVYTRMNWIAALRFELATVVAPRHIKSNMSDLEVAWFQKYSRTLANYMRSLSQATQTNSASIYGIDLTQYTRPPKSLYIHVRCLQDYGDFELSDGHTVSLVTHSQHYLLASDVDQLIKQGTLEHID